MDDCTILDSEILDSGMGSSDIRSPEVKSILFDEEDEDVSFPDFFNYHLLPFF